MEAGTIKGEPAIEDPVSMRGIAKFDPGGSTDAGTVGGELAAEDPVRMRGIANFEFDPLPWFLSLD